MHLFASLIFLIAATVKDEEVEDVAPKAKDRCDQHDFAIDFIRVQQSFNCLDEKPDQEAPYNNDTTKGSDYFRAIVPIRALECRWFPRQVNCQKRDDEACDITQLMSCIAEDGQGA